MLYRKHIKVTFSIPDKRHGRLRDIFNIKMEGAGHPGLRGLGFRIRL